MNAMSTYVVHILDVCVHIYIYIYIYTRTYKLWIYIEYTQDLFALILS